MRKTTEPPAAKRATPAKRGAKPAATKKSAGRGASTEVVAEIFKTREEPTEQRKVRKNAVLLYVNGDERGEVDTTGQTLIDFVKAHASRAGIRTFSVYVDGRKADTSQSGSKLDAFTKIEIVAKDARGSDEKDARGRA